MNKAKIELDAVISDYRDFRSIVKEKEIRRNSGQRTEFDNRIIGFARANELELPPYPEL